ncbi:hypothetical protein T484DRAFT_1810449, partial [Baffinella frigidus]
MAGPGWLSTVALATIAGRRAELSNPVLTLEEVSDRKLTGEHLIIVENMVFFVGEFMRQHPGGESSLLKLAGKDATTNFRQAHGSSAHDPLAVLFIGDLGKVSSNSAPFKGKGTPVHNSPFHGSGGAPAAGSKTQPSLALPKLIEKKDSLARWPMLGDLAKLQGLTTISPLIAGQEHVAAAAGNTLTSVFTMGNAPVSVTPPVDSPIPSGDPRESIFNRRADPSPSPGSPMPMPPPGHGGGSTDMAACPFMALQNFVEQSSSAAGGLPGDVAGIMQAQGHERAFMQPQIIGSAASVAPSQRQSMYGEESVSGSKRSGYKRSNGTKSSEKTSNYAGSASQAGSKAAPSSAIGSGGVFRDHRQKRRGGQKKVTADRTPPTDMARWARAAASIRESWEVILKRSSFMEIGAAVYERIMGVEVLEVLFSFTDRALQGRKFVDMLNSIMLALDAPNEVFSKMMELAPLHHRR